ncbi:methyltransferase domain-containing protein [uncultured Desulfobulbus sp.]|uniref:methyltransferase domain-containing protein n=1 Tax=uncultured Desulfobulbus sp. TaxID=239745 RepID=UPI0029C670A8|nr:methyltransferase domain-containing protein [uncultured Desulfobulbus sp.]
MEHIDQYSRAAVEFTLTWNSEKASHTDQLWADPVSFWRDVLVPQLANGLLGKGVGERETIVIPAGRFPSPFDTRKRVMLRPEQFLGTDSQGNGLTPSPGRFYPQGLLSGVSGVYRASTSPCRCLGREGECLVFDLNHPLAGRDLVLQAEIAAIHPPQKKERGGRCEDWLERISSDGPGMQAGFTGEGGVFTKGNFTRRDEQPDALFYRQPRLVHHLDSTARAAISRRYADLIRPGSRVLDLMGSWTSHLPDRLELSELTVLGMNEEELRQNHRATATVVQDLNGEPQLFFTKESFDAVICTASVEYLTNPLAIMTEIRRILRPGGLLAFAFSNRWFPPKAIRLWSEMHEFERLGLVAELFHATGGFNKINTLSRRGLPRPTDDPHQELWVSDPVYMVWGMKA